MEEFKRIHKVATFTRNAARNNIFDFTSGDKLPFHYFSYEPIKTEKLRNSGATHLIQNWNEPRIFSGLTPIDFGCTKEYFFGDFKELKSTFVFYWSGMDDVTIVYYEGIIKNSLPETERFLKYYANELIKRKGDSDDETSLSKSSNE